MPGPEKGEMRRAFSLQPLLPVRAAPPLLGRRERQVRPLLQGFGLPAP
jgi:hypothetical protein